MSPQTLPRPTVHQPLRSVAPGGEVREKKRPAQGRFVDFDLHGLVGIRLIDPSDGDVKAVRRQLGPIDRTLDREPDITVRFVPRLELGPNVRLLGLGETGFTDEHFVVLRGKGQQPIRAIIPIDRLGGPCEIVCQSGAPAVPLLIAAVNLTTLARGTLPLHAAAFNWQGRGVLVTGWAKGGKTETLLAFMAQGAEYVGDDWVYLDDAGGMYGIPEPIRIWDWHVADMPGYRRQLARRTRLRWWAIKRFAAVLDAAAANRLGQRVLPARLFRRLTPLMRRQLHVQMPPHELFAGQIGSMSGRPDVVIFAGSHASDEVCVRRADPHCVAHRMVHSLQDEQQVLRSHYEQFRFAFPGRTNEVLEDSARRQRELLVRCLDHQEVYEVLHPYPAPLPRLYAAIRPLIA